MATNHTNDIEEGFASGLAWKLEGGMPIDIFVSKGIWLGGLHEMRAHQPFVAIGPLGWEGEDELTFFKNRREVESFIERLRIACDAAFLSEDDPEGHRHP